MRRVPQTMPTGRHHEASPWAFGGMIGIASAFFLIAATSTVIKAPWWVVAGMLAVWLLGLVQGCRWFVRRPAGVATIAVSLCLGWFVVVMSGARWLGWTSA